MSVNVNAVICTQAIWFTVLHALLPALLYVLKSTVLPGSVCSQPEHGTVLQCVYYETADALEKEALLRSRLMSPEDNRGSWGRPQATLLLGR